MKSLTRALVGTIFGLAVHASAEPRVCIGGDLDRLSQAQKNVCWSSAKKVRADATEFHAPEDWHFYIICTESDWTTYASFSKRGAELTSLNVDTDMDKRATYFRGEALTLGDPYNIRRLIAREAAKGLLQTLDEVALQKQVSLWIPEDNRGLILTASR